MKIPFQKTSRKWMLRRDGDLSMICNKRNISLFTFIPVLLMIIINGCITEFIPAVTEPKLLLVVEGLITDQPETDTIKLSRSMPLGNKSEAIPLAGCIVKISDDLGNIYDLKEIDDGKYITDSATFRGVVGRSYILHISVSNGNRFLNYESYPSEMKPVPPIDSLYYEKTVIREKTQNDPLIEGCHILLNTRDPENNCKFFRWDFTETWVLRLLWPVDNMTCWITENSKLINIKSTDAIAEPYIDRYPINYISNETDRLKRKYSILVNQYSLNEDEFIFWEKLRNITQQVGGLYDIIPSTIASNLQCVEIPGQTVLGYFSVSAKKSKRIFIKDDFAGIIDHYANCVYKTVYTDDQESIPFINVSVWALEIHHGSFGSAPYTILTRDRGCSDCTVRGSKTKPDFWEDK
jgi:hypothetical protein